MLISRATLYSTFLTFLCLTAGEMPPAPEKWMKSLFKVTLLATTMAVALHAPISFAADAAKKETAAAADSKAAFKNDDQKSAYALGASLGRYMENSLKEQEKLGIKLDKAQLIAGVQDAFADKSKLSDRNRTDSASV